MTGRRQGGRAALALVAALVLGCRSESPPTPTTVQTSKTVAASRLHPPDDQPSGVVALAWGGSSASRRLGVVFQDGRFALYQPDRGLDPIVKGRDPEHAAQTLAIVEADRLVTASDAGLTLWDVAKEPPSVLDRQEIGSVEALAVDREGDLFAALADGRLIRFSLSGGASTLVAKAERPADGPTAVRGLLMLDEGRGLITFQADGRARRLRRDLNGKAEDLGQARCLAFVGRDRVARMIDPPTLVVEPIEGPGPVRRLTLARPATALLAAKGGTTLVMAGVGEWLVVDLNDTRRPLDARVVPAAPGPTIIAIDPDDRSGRRLAIADASGLIEVLDLDAFTKRARPRSPDEVAEWAFVPERRLDRSRTVEVGAKLEPVREALERNEMAGVPGLLRDLETDATLSPVDDVERHVLNAAYQRRNGWPTSMVLKSLEQARAGFSRLGLVDREADMRFWQGLLLAPGLHSPTGDPDQTTDALERLQQALDLYQSRDPSSIPGLDDSAPRSRASSASNRDPKRLLDGVQRQVVLCEALEAWCLLGLGNQRAAADLFAKVLEASQTDPVLSQVVELDRIAAAIAAGSGHWNQAEQLDARVLKRLEGDQHDRLGLRLEARLARVGALSALGRWKDASRLLDLNGPDTDEWRLRRATVEVRAGRTVPMPEPDDDDPGGSHVRGRLLAGSPDRSSWTEAVRELNRAAEAHRQAGRDPLAVEADLECAETLERLGRPAEAVPIYAGLARRVRLALATDQTRRAASPLLDDPGRPFRGLARCALALDQPAAVLSAIDGADLAAWFRQAGETIVGSVPLGLALEDRPLLEQLRSARRDGTRTDVRRLETRLSTHRSWPTLTDPSGAFDPALLGLNESTAVLVVAKVGPESLVEVVVRGHRVVKARALSASRSELRHAVQAWRRGLADGGRDLEPNSQASSLGGLLSLVPEPDASRDAPPPSAKTTWESYFEDVLIQPIAESLDGVTRLIIVPDDALGALPFEAMGRSSRLMQRYSIRYAPSVTLLRWMRESKPVQPGPIRRALLLAKADLPGLAAAWRSSGLVVESATGPSARPARLLNPAPSGFDLMFVASNATLDPRLSPWGDLDLRLSDNANGLPDNGRLTATELLSAPLSSRLLILCPGDPTDRARATGPGLRDLARAALAAGAESVVLSLWDPPSTSSLLFQTEIGRALAKGDSPGQALDRARLTVARDPRFRDPVHWAGSVLYGLPEP
ncbi:MAG: CHAT domain-containing protein [Isosphaeraceae bacterium]